MQRWPLAITGCLLLLPVAALQAQSLYKYKGKNGEIIYTDRKPPDQDNVETRRLSNSQAGKVSLAWDELDGRRRLVARNSLYAPVLLQLYPAATGELKVATGTWVVPAQGSRELLVLDMDSPAVEYRFLWLYGDPDAEHRPTEPYRAPFPAAVTHPVSQAWPHSVTHSTPDSLHAIDIAMPVGSDVLAARAGVVVEVATTNFRSSIEGGKSGANANIVRILHDDGTFAIYAHLNWNSIRVRPGQRVSRGEYIADSGNTGFSTGPHLHFVVLKNGGTRLESLPVRFSAADGGAVVPRTGSMLGAY